MYLYNSTAVENKKEVSINIPWDSNTFKGWIIALAITSFGILLFDRIDILPQRTHSMPINNTIPLTILNLGSGDGTGLKSGNLTEEGAMKKGEKPKMNLQDASTSSNVKNNVQSNTNSTGDKYIPVKEMASNSTNKTIAGEDEDNIGNEKGNTDLMASGLGIRGKGKGKGDGFGDIDWGGGGNRTVLSKVLPNFPSNVKSSSQIVLQFKVLPDGTVTSIIPIQKADPELEQAAILALKKWKFNPLPNGSNEIMIGKIPLTFILR